MLSLVLGLVLKLLMLVWLLMMNVRFLWNFIGLCRCRLMVLVMLFLMRLVFVDL